MQEAAHYHQGRRARTHVQRGMHGRVEMCEREMHVRLANRGRALIHTHMHDASGVVERLLVSETCPRRLLEGLLLQTFCLLGSLGG